MEGQRSARDKNRHVTPGVARSDELELGFILRNRKQIFILGYALEAMKMRGFANRNGTACMLLLYWHLTI